MCHNVSPNHMQYLPAMERLLRRETPNDNNIITAIQRQLVPSLPSQRGRAACNDHETPTKWIIIAVHPNNHHSERLQTPTRATTISQLTSHHTALHRIAVGSGYCAIKAALTRQPGAAAYFLHFHPLRCSSPVLASPPPPSAPLSSSHVGRPSSPLSAVRCFASSAAAGLGWRQRRYDRRQ